MNDSERKALADGTTIDEFIASERARDPEFAAEWNKQALTGAVAQALWHSEANERWVVRSVDDNDEEWRLHKDFYNSEGYDPFGFFPAFMLAKKAIAAIRDLIAAADAPGLDELLDSVHEGACIRNMYSHKGRSSVTVGVPIERPSGGWSGYIEHIATGPTRMDAIRNAVAQATTTQEGASDSKQEPKGKG